MDELQWMVRSCLNLGNYTQVRTQEEVREQVLKYIPVVARPLVLQNVHPIAWTHAYTDITVRNKIFKRSNFNLIFSRHSVSNSKKFLMMINL